MKKTSYLVLASVALIAAGIVLALWWSGVLNAGTAGGGASFDPAIWGRSVGTNVRWSMLDDLNAHHLRVGMSENDVRTLLGSPDRVLPPLEVIGAKLGDGNYLYFDVSAPGKQFDTRMFVVILDPKSRVIRWGMYED